MRRKGNWCSWKQRSLCPSPHILIRSLINWDGGPNLLHNRTVSQVNQVSLSQTTSSMAPQLTV